MHPELPSRLQRQIDILNDLEKLRDQRQQHTRKIETTPKHYSLPEYVKNLVLGKTPEDRFKRAGIDACAIGITVGVGIIGATHGNVPLFEGATIMLGVETVLGWTHLATGWGHVIRAGEKK